MAAEHRDQIIEQLKDFDGYQIWKVSERQSIGTTTVYLLRTQNDKTLAQFTTYPALKAYVGKLKDQEYQENQEKKRKEAEQKREELLTNTFKSKTGKPIKGYVRGKYSYAQSQASRKYGKLHYDYMSLSVPKGEKQKYKDAAVKAGLSFNQFIVAALDEKIVRDGLKEVFDSASQSDMTADNSLMS